ncbi:MAG: DNA mismatch repair endonuclease MutL [Ktedonobacteraceae bacterium]|nr:DNA mismatch repair endonuclease MutL [Ktedonobacteraceae bacterium]
MSIRQLAPDVAAKIAAGEVVERPASVVKELIENSIDAGATQIRVDLMNGGLQLIRVTDNGCGIPPDELPLALARHATSKVAQIEDLEHIRSLGFRGEALASIAAVAEVTLVSRAHGADQAAQIEAINGQLSQVTPAALPQGTSLTVRNLFSAVPARLKFLKSRNTEVSHCHHLLEQYALAYPEIRFNVFSDGRQIFSTPGDGQLASVLVEVYGLQIAQQMIPLQSKQRPDDSTYPVVTGYTSRPTCYKSTRQHISFFVNRRWVMSRMLIAAVEGAYHSLLLSGRHPIAVINVQLDPALLDVNVHPAKTEIRFLKERRVFAAILRAVRAALLEEPQMPRWQPHKESEEPLDEDEVAVFSSATHGDPQEQVMRQAGEMQEEIQEKTTEEENEDTPAFPMDNPWLTVSEEESGTKPPLLARLWQSHVRPLTGAPEGAEAAPSITGQKREQASPSPANIPAVDGEQRHEMSGRRAQQQEMSLPSSALPTHSDYAGNRQSEIPAGSLAGEQIEQQAGRRLPRLRVVGQLAQSYIVTEGEDGSMYLIDQHAAHERILLERMVAALKASTPISQLLLTPLRLDLAPRELEAVEEHLPQLEHIGFTLEIADSALLVRAVPGVLVRQMNTRSVQELLIELTSDEHEHAGQTETWEERALANVACKAAIKQHYFLTISEMREMLEQLEKTKAPFSCCHGRPTMIHFSLSALAREFERR